MNAEDSMFRHLQGVALTDIGRKRKNNEDSYGEFPDFGVWCVADGMGGGDDGEVASAAVVKSVDAFLSDLPSVSGGAYSANAIAKGVVSAVEEASGWIYRRTKKKNLKGCGSTFVCVVFDATDPGSATVLHVGDSRLYRLRGKDFKQITKDHSVAEMMGAKDESQISPMFRGMILRAVGIENSVEVEKTSMSVAEGDIVLVCSDGLSRMVPDKRISEILKNGRDDVEGAAKRLVAEANDAGGVDNITVALVKVGRLPSALPAVGLADEEEPSRPSSALHALDREYGGSIRRIALPVLAVTAAVGVLFGFGTLVYLSKMREKQPLHEAPVIQSMPKIKQDEVKAPVSVKDKIVEENKESNVTDQEDSSAFADPQPASSVVASVAKAATVVDNDKEAKVRDAVENELRKERERRRREDESAARLELERKRVARELAMCHDQAFEEFAMFADVVLGKGTSDRARSLCRRLHMSGKDVDASLFAADFTVEVADIARRLDEKCQKVDARPGGAVSILIEKCRSVTGGDPASTETQARCLELINYVNKLRRPSNAGR